METFAVILFRSIERMASIIIGCYLIYLGYRLFLEIPVKADSEGKFTLPGGTAIHLTRVGPGIFFSLFGTAVLVFSLVTPVDYKEGIKTDTAGKIERSVSYLGAERAENSGDVGSGLGIERSSLQMDLIVLNHVDDQLREDLSEDELFDISQAIPRIKLAVMKSVWDRQWGEYREFKKWLDRGGDVENPPEKFRPALEYFNRQ
ncbi:MAG: hypothetical protein KKD01_11530 [Proteobacteria bacterium]|nr:hypothetical protein [Pseudomonadota bacterium]MBU1232836.1 hypothetical protein [Pseudomonadota bacterium]MBU1418394.1 hypothetical protein [Pseudomonadota bacterium]MBU1455348.1 hypothetical protein [Pseudomonadota bacterium]